MTLKYYDYEDMMDEVKSILENKLSAAITEINILKPDAFVIPNPTAIYFGLRRVDPNIDAGIFIIAITMNLAEGITFNHGETDEEATIDVIPVYWGSSSEEVERKMLRMTRVIRKVLDENQIHAELIPRSDNIKDSVVSALDYNPSDFQGDVYMKSATVRIAIKDVWTYEV